MQDQKLNNNQLTLRTEIDAVELLITLKSHWKVLISSIFILVAIGFTYAHYQVNIYKAEVVLMVASKNNSSFNQLENSEVSLNQKLVSTYTEIAQSASIMRNVAQNLDLDGSPESLAKKVKVVPVGMTELIKISYTDENPQKAALIANQVSEEFMVKIKSVMSFDNLKIVESARVPNIPETKWTKLVVVISGMIGVILGVLEILWREYYQNKLKRPEDIEKILGCQVLANIPDYSVVKLDKSSKQLNNPIKQKKLTRHNIFKSKKRK